MGMPYCGNTLMCDVFLIIIIEFVQLLLRWEIKIVVMQCVHAVDTCHDVDNVTEFNDIVSLIGVMSN